MQSILIRVRTVAVFALPAGLLACGGNGGSEADLQAAGNGNAAAETSPRPLASPDQEPADGTFPIPYPEGGEVITDGWDGTSGHITVRYPAARHEEVVTFYNDYTADGDWNRSEVGQGEVPTVNYMNLLEGRNITVGPPTGESMLVTLTVSS